MKKAVLLLTFNRLDNLKRTFEEIKIAKPPRLYISSDGARPKKNGEKEIVEDVRKYLLDNINWDCEVKTKFNEENLGCGRGVSSAIDWFFENEEDGIILEDDCLANQSFFAFCEELLDYHKENKQVWQILGNQFITSDKKSSYYFTKIQHCWGWATWADRWKHFDFNLKNYDKKNIENFSENKNVQEYWINILNSIEEENSHTWAYQWTLKIVENNGLCINPTKNLVSNIGCDGVHFDEDNSLMNLPTFAISEIIHPKKLDFDQESVDKIYQKVFSINKSPQRRRRLHAKLKKQEFHPTWLGLFINPFYFSRKDLYKYISSFSRKIRGANILDVGCGSKPYQSLFRVKQYDGLEYDTPKNRRKKGAEYFYDGITFPFENGTYDNVISSQVLEHTPVPEIVLAEINRVLKPDGLLILSAPLVWDEHEQPYDYYRFTSFALKMLLEKHGFEILKFHKSCNNISTIFQLLNDYIYKKLIGKNKLPNRIVVNSLCSIFNIIGAILVKITPENNDLYLDSIVLARKIKCT